MTRILLPRWGAGNGVTWTPNITAVTRGTSLSVGERNNLSSNNTAPVTGTGALGPSHFDTSGSTGWWFSDNRGVSFSAHYIGNLMLANLTTTGQRSHFMAAFDGNPCVGYVGEPVIGMFLLELDRLTFAQQGRLMKLILGIGVQYAGVDNTIRKQFTKNGNTYELLTWVRSSTAQSGNGLDTWAATGWMSQLTFTWVPYEASLNAAGAAAPVKQNNPNSGVINAQIYGLPYNIFAGGTLYMSVTKSTVDSVQQWIIGDLIESEDFASSVQPHYQLPGTLASTLAAPITPNMPIVLPTTGDTDSYAQLYLYGIPTLVNTPSGIQDPMVGGNKPPMVTNRPTIGGAGTISGVVKVNNVAYPNQKVLLFRMPDHLLMGYQWSKADGSYSFPDLNPAYEYLVMSHDYSRTYNAVVQDMVVPVVPTLVTTQITSRRKSLTLTGYSGAGTGHTVQIRVAESVGATGYDAVINAKAFPTYAANADSPGDVSFKLADGTTLPSILDQVTGTTPNRVALFWVGVQNLDLSTPKTIYVHYQHNAETPASNQGAFSLFENFNGTPLNTSKWVQAYWDKGESRSLWDDNTATGLLTKQTTWSYTFAEAASVAKFPDGYELVFRNGQGQLFAFGDYQNQNEVMGHGWGTKSNNDMVMWVSQHYSSPTANLHGLRLPGDTMSTALPAGAYFPGGKISGASLYYNLFQIGRKGGTGYLKINGAPTLSRTGVSTADAAITANMGKSTSQGSPDWIGVRKVQDTEVTVTAVGNEEQVA